jgi:uncharacterized protein (TIGR03437 family)
MASRTILFLVLAQAGFGQAAPTISNVTTVPNIAFDSRSVLLSPGSSATISGKNLADSTASAAAPGQPRLGGIEIHLVDTSCQTAGCELIASLLYTSPTRIDFVVPSLPDITRVWRTRVVVIKNAQRYDGLTAPDRVILDAIYFESSPNPALTGQPVTFSAHVAAMQGDPQSAFYSRVGAVNFMDGDTPLGMVNLSNVITYVDEAPLRRYDVYFTTSKLAPGKHSIRADYSGDHSNTPKSSGTIIQAISVPEVSITSIPNPSIFGQTVAIIVTVSPSTCTGTVAFFDASAPSSLAPPAFGPVADESGKLGTAKLDRGRALFSTAALIVGDHPINVKYSGDANCAPLGYAPANDFEYRTTSQTVVAR